MPRKGWKPEKEIAIGIGDCFRFANNFVDEYDIPEDEWDDVTIVHAIVYNRYPQEGERDWYEHAWAEYKGYAYDWQGSTTEDPPRTIEEFYEFFLPKKIKRYTVEEALVNQLKYFHHGPWD